MQFLIGLFNTIFSIIFPNKTKEEIDDFRDPSTLSVMRQCVFCNSFVPECKECKHCNEIKIWV